MPLQSLVKPEWYQPLSLSNLSDLTLIPAGHSVKCLVIIPASIFNIQGNECISSLFNMQPSFQHEETEVMLTENPRPKRQIDNKMPFGAEYSDHMLLINWTKINGWDIPKIVPYGNLSLSPALSALHYSTQVVVRTCYMVCRLTSSLL